MDLKAFLEVTKPKQTALLMITFVVSFIVAGGDLKLFIISFLATTFAVMGTTALNMWLDRDIDAKMLRTKERPLPSGKLSPKACAVYGTTLFLSGCLISLLVRLELFLVLFLGFVFDIVVYTVLLKRKSPYSIVLGGIAGAMPALAGWVSVEGFTLPGFIIAAIVLLWIPAHIWYIAMFYEEDYRRAGIPMYPLVFGMERTSWIIVATTFLMLLLAASLYILLDLSLIYLAVSIAAVLFLLLNAVKFARKPSRVEARKMYKRASFTLAAVYLSMLLSLFL